MTGAVPRLSIEAASEWRPTSRNWPLNSFAWLSSVRTEKRMARERARCCQGLLILLHRRASLLTLLSVTLLHRIPAAEELYGQADTGSIQGTVHDRSGTPLPGAKVALTNQQSYLTKLTVTSREARYLFAEVKGGLYTISVEC